MIGPTLGNIRAETEDGGRTIKLLDFGVAKIKRAPTDMHGDAAGLTRTGSLLGSPLYMSPEQARSVKNVDHRSDLWSMGVVLYQAVAGRTPYEHVSGLGDLILSLCSDLPPPVQQFAPWVQLRVAAVIDRALRLDPGERFATAAEMHEAITALLPEGHAIRGDMLVPLDAATREDVAPTPSNAASAKPAASVAKPVEVGAKNCKHAIAAGHCGDAELDPSCTTP